MSLTLFTLVLDGQPWIERHYPVFKTLDLDWRWIICEGVAANTNCTSWCAKIPPRLSEDGTHEYLETIKQDPRITVTSVPSWSGGKVQMCNVAASYVRKPGLLWQVDSDEIWTKAQIEAVVKLFATNPRFNSAFFQCHYFVGPDIVTVGRNCYGNNSAYEWKRVWRFQPGMRFRTHEPPILEGVIDRPIPHNLTTSHDCVFDHFAYATERQVEFKQRYYAGGNNPMANLYRNAVDGWRRLQDNKVWPTRLKPFLPWVDDRVMAARL